MNKKELFNDGWEFSKTSLDSPQDHSQLIFEPIDIPHDWLIYDTLNLYENSIGWYRKKFSIEKGDLQVLLCFDGVYMDSTLYVNNQYVGEWKYGYSSFEHNITDALVDGENEILVKVIHQSPNSRWYSGAGIYRNVWVKTRDKNHIVTGGIYISTKKGQNRWVIEVETTINHQHDVVISQTLLYKDQVISNSTKEIRANSSNTILQQVIEVENPLLWDTDFPHLYELKTQLYLVNKHKNESLQEIETITQKMGFREIEFDPGKGLSLNGTKLKLNGVCEHHDLGALGAAFNKTALKRRFTILKEMGVNAIRTAHNMPAKELMELADEMGFLVVTEAFDMWERSKTPYDYARFFKEWAYFDIKSWVMRDRNHPSLLMWSIGNEIYDTHAEQRGQEITKLLLQYVKEFDPKGNASVTIGSNYMPWENAQKCADIVKIAGYNYAEKYYKKHHEEHPDWIIYGSETASVVQSRGIYHFPYEKSILADDDEQCSALGNSSTSWGAKSAEACILAERDTPFSLGQFIWTGFDYIGEPTPYHTKNSYFGQIDTASFKKDSYYIYQSAWTNYKTAPMIHIFPYWNFNKGQMIDVRVCSNAPKIELQLNGRSIGIHEIDQENGTDLVGWWKVPYEKGELKAFAYDESDNIIAMDVRRSFGNAKNICLKPDKNNVIANGTDLLFLEITMEDEHGNPVEDASNRVEVHVSGEGRLVGLDNGDSTDFDQYKGTSRRLFSGKLMAIIASTLKPGKIKIEVSSKGLETQAIEIGSSPYENLSLHGITANIRNIEMPIVLGSKEEIPVRNIEIISELGQFFNDCMTEMTVHANIYPDDATYQDVEWSVVNESGIRSNIAKVVGDGKKAKVTALGDGEFRIRCTSKNGSEKIKLISQLEFKAEGLGKAYKDPYEFISAGLYDYCKGEVTNGNDRGVATSRDGETHVGFREIDFGPYGSDSITIPIFALSSEQYPIQIWEGMPGEEDSQLLADVVYQKPSKWNVYQEETYQLSKRLCGITSLCFVVNQKVHIKGFIFEKKNKAYEKNMAAECDHIYGDRFTMREEIVEGIGNNVSLEFDDMHFTGDGATKLTIYGRSHHDKNTIQLSFLCEEVETKQMIEFTKTDIFEQKTFQIEKISGKQKVTFIFLPGCHFDFGWFRFE